MVVERIANNPRRLVNFVLTGERLSCLRVRTEYWNQENLYEQGVARGVRCSPKSGLQDSEDQDTLPHCKTYYFFFCVSKVGSIPIDTQSHLPYL